MSMRQQLAELMQTAEQYKGRELTEDEVGKVNELAEQITNLKGRIAEAEKAAANMASVFAMDGDHDENVKKATASGLGKTMGERFVKSDAMKNHRGQFPNGISRVENAFGISVQVGKKADGDDAGSDAAAQPGGDGATVLSRPVAGLPLVGFEPGIVNPLEWGRRLSILDLITKGTTEATSLKYRQLVDVTNNAAVVPESLNDTGEEYVKPLSLVQLAAASATDTTYADGIVVTTQEWADDGALRAMIDGMLSRNIELVTEKMILNGTGENDEPLGILNFEDLKEQAFDTDIFKTVRMARAQLDALGYRASAIVMSSADAAALDLMKMENGTYYGGGPLAAGNVTNLWGIPVIESPVVEDGTAIMGDWSTIHLLTVDPLNINVFDQHKDYAQRNLLYLRAEYRALQLLRAPASFVKVELGN